MRKAIFLFVLIFSSFRSSFAQQFNNSFKLHTDGFYVPESANYRPVSQIGFSYERKVFQNFSVSLGFHQWMTWTGRDITMREPFAISEPVGNYHGGQLPGGAWVFYRDQKLLFDGKMADLSIKYRYPIGKHQHISAGLGGSYFGAERQIYRYVKGNEPAEGNIDIEKVRTFGVVPQVSYGYSFLKNRLSVGADVRARYYTKRVGGQYDYGVHVGVNF